MNNNKKYKTLAEGAAGQPDDYRSARLRVIHQTYVAKKKEAKEDRPISVRGDKRPTPRMTPRTLRCGLCERDVPPDHLVGSALRRTIEKLRHQSPNLSKSVPLPRKSEFHASAEDEREEHATTPKQHVKKQSLYDYEVRLCVNCDIF